MPHIADDYIFDPEPPDESDPAFQEEIFQVCRSLGWAPDDLFDKEFAARYAEWLKALPEEKLCRR